MTVITANELKTKGISSLEKATKQGSEAMISVRGQNRYVVMSVETYNRLRECELDAAIAESKRDLAEGRYVKESVEKHIKRITRG
jgi:PHD/YefM family antitoxin component YafN of YafNO toxin-antitoxin module